MTNSPTSFFSSSPTPLVPSLPLNGFMQTILVIFVIAGTVVTGIVTYFMIRVYSVPNIRPVVRVCMWIGWFYCYCHVFLIPADITITFLGEPGSSDSSQIPDLVRRMNHVSLNVVWAVGYWINFVWSWILLPFLQEYYEAGEFNFGGRFKRSLRNNIIIYVVAGLFGLIVLGITYAATTRIRDVDSLQGYVMCLSHLFGSTVAMLLLGYGLVSIPRGLWQRTKREVMKEKYEFEVSKISQFHQDAKYLAVQVFDFYDQLKKKIKAGPNRELDPLLDRIDEYIILNTEDTLRNDSMSNYSKFLEAELQKNLQKIKEKPVAELNQKDLAAVNYAIKQRIAVYRLHSENLKSTLRDAVFLCRAMKMADTTTTIPKWRDGFSKACYHRYSVRVERKLLRVFAVSCGVMSTLIMWSELTMWTPVELSPFGLIIVAARDVPIILQLLCLIPWSYMCLCAFHAVFRLKIFTLYNMSRNRASSETSLLLNCYYTTRFIGPLAYNFLVSNGFETTEFQLQQGDMTVVPFFGSTFNNLYPILLLLFFIATGMNVFGKCLQFLRISRNQAQQEAAANIDRMEGVRLIERACRTWTDKTMQSLKNIDLTPLE